MMQSPSHRHFSLADLEWMALPPLTLEQFRLFYEGKGPVGLALWAYLSPESEERMAEGAVRLRPDEWRAGGGLPPMLQALAAQKAAKEGDAEAAKAMLEKARADEAARRAQAAEGGSAQSSAQAGRPADSATKKGALWLVELIAPAHTAETQHREKMLADLMNGPFKGKTFKTVQVRPDGSRKVLELG